MDRTAVITGSPARVGEVAIAFKEGGCSVTEVPCREHLDDVARVLGPGSVDAYVQLPWDVDIPGSSTVGQVHGFLHGGLLTRFLVMSELLPLLRPGASVVLVAGHRPADIHVPDHSHARRSLLRLLARAVEADTAAAGVRTAVLSDQCSPDDIAELALHQRPEQPPRLSQYSAYGEELSFADWKRDIMAMTTPWSD